MTKSKTLVNDLLVLRQLNKSVKDCEAYDGYDSENMLEYFITNNGFNPIEELKIFKKKLMRKYCSKEIVKIIKEVQDKDELEFEKLMELQLVMSDLTEDESHKAIILELLKTGMKL